MASDILKQLGALAFASRLKRLSERLMHDVARVYRERDLDFEPRWFPLGFLLQRRSSLSVTEIADALGLTHPAVSQIAARMESAGLLESVRDQADERRRLLSLSNRGKETLRTLEPIWTAIEKCTTELIREIGQDFLGSVDQIEQALDRRNMYDRVTDELHHSLAGETEIVAYQPQYREYFGAINREWLEEFFEVEDHDAAVLDDPKGTILRLGGEIIFARLHGEIVGTAALLRGPSGHFEIAKMGVTKSVRGRGIGRKLALYLIERARQYQARQVVLATSPMLKAAISLYRSLGFKEYEPNRAWRAQYKRYTVFMKLDLVTNNASEGENPMRGRRIDDE